MAQRFSDTHWQEPERTSEEDEDLSSSLYRLLSALVAALVGAVLFEAATLAGSFTRSVFDLASWRPARMLVFFCAVFGIFLWVTRPHERPNWWVWGKNLACVLGSLLCGLIVGIFVSALMQDAGDVRYGLSIACFLAAALLLFLNRDLVCQALEWGYLILALAFGLTFCLLMPPSAEISWDGSTHFKNANALSYLVDAEYTGADQMMVIGGLEGALYLTGDLSGVEEHPVELDSRVVQFRSSIRQTTSCAQPSETVAWSRWRARPPTPRAATGPGARSA